MSSISTEPEQVSFFDTPPSNDGLEPWQEAFKARVEPVMHALLDKYQIYHKHIKFTTTKEGDFTVKYRNSVVCAAHYKGIKYIRIPDKYSYLLDKTTVTRESKQYRISLEDIADVDKYMSVIASLLNKELHEYGDTSWGCCSRYVGCSDARKCIHPDLDFAMDCYYKINLNDGRIFYGKNKTI